MTGFEGTLNPVLDLLADVPVWRSDAACAGVDLDVFFPVTTGPGPGRYKEAAAVCADCPAIGECLADARRLGDIQGFRAGLSPLARERLFAGGGEAECDECGGSFNARNRLQRFCGRRSCQKVRHNLYSAASRRRARRDEEAQEVYDGLRGVLAELGTRESIDRATNVGAV